MGTTKSKSREKQPSIQAHGSSIALTNADVGTALSSRRRAPSANPEYCPDCGCFEFLCNLCDYFCCPRCDYKELKIMHFSFCEFCKDEKGLRALHSHASKLRSLSPAHISHSEPEPLERALAPPVRSTSRTISGGVVEVPSRQASAEQRPVVRVMVYGESSELAAHFAAAARGSICLKCEAQALQTMKDKLLGLCTSDFAVLVVNGAVSRVLIDDEASHADFKHVLRRAASLSGRLPLIVVWAHPSSAHSDELIAPELESLFRLQPRLVPFREQGRFISCGEVLNARQHSHLRTIFAPQSLS